MREALLVGDAVMVASVALVLWIAARRSPFRASRRRATAASTVDLLPTPGRVRTSSATRSARPVPAHPPRADPAPAYPATWSASQERADANSSVERPRRATPQPANVAPAAAPPVEPRVEPRVEHTVEPAVAPAAVASPLAVADRSEPGRSVLVVPRSKQWIVQRPGARRASSVHATRDAAEEQARRTARRERAVFELRNADGVLLDRVDFAASRAST